MDNKLQSLIDIHNEFDDLIMLGNWDEVINRMNYYAERHDVNEIQTVLVITKNIKHLSESRAELVRIQRSLLNKFP